MTSQPQPTTGASAEFGDDRAVRRAVQELERAGVARTRILVSGVAPDQSSTPIDTSVRDQRMITNLWNLAVRGAVLGLIGGAVFGAVLGSLIWSPMSPAWLLLSVGMAVFGIGLGMLWSLLIGKGESTHMGTVYDEPAADQPTTVTVRPEDPDQVDRLVHMLEEAGGRNVRRMPSEADRPER